MQQHAAAKDSISTRVLKMTPKRPPERPKIIKLMHTHTHTHTPCSALMIPCPVQLLEALCLFVVPTRFGPRSWHTHTRSKLFSVVAPTTTCSAFAVSSCAAFAAATRSATVTDTPRRHPVVCRPIISSNQTLASTSGEQYEHTYVTNQCRCVATTNVANWRGKPKRRPQIIYSTSTASRERLTDMSTSKPRVQPILYAMSF